MYIGTTRYTTRNYILWKIVIDLLQRGANRSNQTLACFLNECFCITAFTTVSIGIIMINKLGYLVLLMVYISCSVITMLYCNYHGSLSIDKKFSCVFGNSKWTTNELKSLVNWEHSQTGVMNRHYSTVCGMIQYLFKSQRIYHKIYHQGVNLHKVYLGHDYST